jgi:uncharacterized protein
MKSSERDADLAAKADAVRPRAFSLELTKGCNLRCGYCYYAARENAYDPATAMSVEVAERSVELLLEQAAPGEPVHLHLFGGEPLANFKLLRHVVEYGERRAREVGRGITFEVTTNGTRFTEHAIAFLNEHAVHVGVSFDGPREVQDAARPALSGSSHAQAEPGIRRLLASRVGGPLEDKTHCSAVVTRRSLDLAAIVAHLEELGFRKIILTPATDQTGGGYGIRESELPELLAAYDRLALDYEDRARSGRRTAVTWFPSLMGRLLSGERRTEFCQGGRDYLGVAADGTVSLCYRFYENDEFAMGDVHTGIDRTVTRRLLELPVEKKLACSTCWARYFCGGGCHHENLITTGGLGEPNPVTCAILRHGMDRTLEAWARLSRDGRVDCRAPVATPPAVTGSTTSTMTSGAYSEDARPKTKPTCHVREVGRERVVYEPTSHEVVVLNPTAHFIFERCDGTRTVRELLDALAHRFDAPRDVLERDLLATLSVLRSKGLLEPAP